MLKIAKYNTITGEKIDLKELEKYGFIYNSEYKEWYSEDSYTAKFCIEEEGKLARILRISDDIYDSSELETLYDLIKDGLVIEEEEE